MFKKFIIILISILLYQTSLSSKSRSLNEFKSKNLSKYFSGIVAFDNKKNSEALNFFNSSKILLNKHDKFLERLVMSLVLEGKVTQAINIIKTNYKKDNSKFFEAYILLSLDSLKKNEIKKAINILFSIPEELQTDRFNYIIVNSLIQYADVFENKKIRNKKNNFGNLSLITETFQRYYLDQTILFFQIQMLV